MGSQHTDSLVSISKIILGEKISNEPSFEQGNFRDYEMYRRKIFLHETQDF